MLPDTQKEQPNFPYPILAGITNLKYPISIVMQNGWKQETIGRFELNCFVNEKQRGIHMSRMVELLNEHSDNFELDALPCFLKKVCKKLETSNSALTVDFTFFNSKKSPVTGKKALMSYPVRMKIVYTSPLMFSTENEVKEYTISYLEEIQITIPVTSVCPCSQAISTHGAHNQRCYITVILTNHVSVDYMTPKPITLLKRYWFEEIIGIIEKCGSAQIYPLLKRPDEKLVTEQAFFHPKFVEDIVREAGEMLTNFCDEKTHFRIRVESQESIHQHNAFASFEGKGKENKE